MTAIATVKVGEDEQTFVLVERGKANPFKSGSRGYHGQGKLTATTGKRYQVNILLVEIGSKPKKGES